MQYEHSKSIADTSIEHAISVQSTPMLKVVFTYMFDIVDTALSDDRELIVCSFLQGFLK